MVQLKTGFSPLISRFFFISNLNLFELDPRQLHCQSLVILIYFPNKFEVVMYLLKRW